LQRYPVGADRSVMPEAENPEWRSLYHFWAKIFDINFGIGVLSGGGDSLETNLFFAKIS